MENGMWQEKPFSRGQAWIDLILLASHKDTEFYFNGTIIPLRKGEMITSKRELGVRWGWSNSKVDKFLNELEKIKKLSQKSDTKKTTIKIEKYGQYQAFDNDLHSAEIVSETNQRRHIDETEAAYRRNRDETEAAQRRTFNNIKKNKNVKNVKKEKNIGPSADFALSGNLPPKEDKEYYEMCKRLDELKRRKQNW